jgi:hypothetical protein
VRDISISLFFAIQTHRLTSPRPLDIPPAELLEHRLQQEREKEKAELEAELKQLHEARPLLVNLSMRSLPLYLSRVFTPPPPFFFS